MTPVPVAVPPTAAELPLTPNVIPAWYGFVLGSLPLPDDLLTDQIAAYRRLPIEEPEIETCMEDFLPTGEMPEGRVHVGARCGVGARIAPPFMEATDASRLVCVVVVSYQEYSLTHSLTDSRHGQGTGDGFLRSRRPHRSRRRTPNEGDSRIREHRGARRKDHPHPTPPHPNPPPPASLPRSRSRPARTSSLHPSNSQHRRHVLPLS